MDQDLDNLLWLAFTAGLTAPIEDIESNIKIQQLFDEWTTRATSQRAINKVEDRLVVEK